jgi:hypothetical protein
MRLLGVLAVVVALAGCGASGTAQQPEGSATARPAAPDVSGTTLMGAKASLADFRGKPLFVIVWSSW